MSLYSLLQEHQVLPMKIKEKMLYEAYEIAVNNLQNHPLFHEKKCFLHYSFLVHDQEIISWSTNNRIIPEKRWGYEKLRRWDDSYIPGTHAELALITRFWHEFKYEFKKFGIINIRLNRHKQRRLSAPCMMCSRWLRALKCSTIIFTTDNGWAEVVYE
ncbi:MAG: hypothetical protein NZZ41_04690 [Candidatus Dojkabacteria bacterium]|nr:hypothetical protein [Candidatus Dojkabacteria bacterium]